MQPSQKHVYCKGFYAFEWHEQCVSTLFPITIYLPGTWKFHLVLQALEVIKKLKETETFEIQRAQMRVRVSIPGKDFYLSISFDYLIQVL